MDFKTPFLNGDLEETIFMKQPQGFSEDSRVCKLNKTIYGLKQSSRGWYRKFTEFIESFNFTKANSDHGLYKLICKEHTTFILIYVDDLLLISNSATKIKEIKQNLRSKF